MKTNTTRNKVIIVFSIAGISAFVAWFVMFLCNIEGLQRKVFFEQDSNDWFMDYFNTVYYTEGRSPYSWGWLPARNYLPIAYLIMYPFSFLYNYNTAWWDTSYASRYSQYPAIAGLAVMIIWTGVLFYFLYRACRQRETEKLLLLSAFFGSSVMLFNLDRANQIIFVAGLMILYIMEYDSKSVVHRQIALIALALAATLKIFPAVLGILLIYKKQYKDAILAVLYGIILAIVPFFWLEGDLISNIQMLWENLKLHAEAYANGSLGITAPTVVGKIFGGMDFISYILFIAAMFAAFKTEKNWKKITLITLSIILTSGQQGDYCMIFMFYPIVLFFNEEQDAGFKNYKWLIWFFLFLCPIQFEFNWWIISITNITVTNTICICMYVVLIAQGLKKYFKKRTHVPAISEE